MKNTSNCPNKTRELYWLILTLASVFIISSILVLFFYLNRSNSNYIYFAKNESIWRISSLPNATPELMAEIDMLSQTTHFARSGDNLIYLTDRNNLEIRQINLSTEDDYLALDCYVIALGGNCLAFDLQPDTNQIVYNFEYYSSEAPLGLFQIRLFSLDDGTDEVLIDIESRLHYVRWVDNKQIEYTTLNGEWWEFNLDTEEHKEIEYESNRIYSPHGRYYAKWEYNPLSPRLLYQYDIYLSDGTRFHESAVEIATEATRNQVSWRPDSSGILYHELHTPIGMPINRLTYYDLSSNETQVIFEVTTERFDNDAFVKAEWSSDGQQILINSSRGLFLYDIQSSNIEELDIEYDFIIGWSLSSNASRNWLSFPEG